MREHAHEGAAAVADLLGRSVKSVRRAAERQRISLRTRGVRCGLVLGQPKGVSLPAALHDDMASGRVSPEAIAERIRLLADGQLCPCCGKRPVQVRSTGWCRVCHLERLTEAHKSLKDEADAQREHAKARQASKRARDRLRRAQEEP